MDKFRAALFDLDGTLLNTLDDLADAVNAALAQNGLPARTLEEVRAFVGNGVSNLMRRAAPEVSTEEHAVLLAAFKAHYAAHMTDKTRPYPGIEALLGELRARGIPCAVVSNKFDAAAKNVCRVCLGDFPAVVIGEGGEIAKKPDPSGCRMALSLLGAKAEDTLYIGDSDVDAATARNAGLACALVTWGFRSREFLEKTGEARILDRPEQLLSCFDKGDAQ